MFPFRTAALLVLFCTLPLVSSAQEFVLLSSLYPVDARGEAMGSAYSAVAEGAFAVYWNTGALALENRAIHVAPYSTSQLWLDDQRVVAGGLVNTGENLGFGLYVSRLHFGERHSFTGEVREDAETSLNIGAGINVLGLLTSEHPNWYVGVGAGGKWLNTRDPEDSALDADLGILLSARFPFHLDHLGPEPGHLGVRLGANLQNLFEAHLEAVPGPFDTSRQRPVVQTIRTGLAVQATLPREEPLGVLASLILSVEPEFHHQNWSGFDSVLHWGGEICVLEILSLRLGYVDPSDGIQDWTYGLGFGGRWTRVKFDMAQLPGREQYSVSAVFAY